MAQKGTTSWASSNKSSKSPHGTGLPGQSPTVIWWGAESRESRDHTTSAETIFCISIQRLPRSNCLANCANCPVVQNGYCTSCNLLPCLLAISESNYCLYLGPPAHRHRLTCINLCINLLANLYHPHRFSSANSNMRRV